jgi:hypothetical protein
MAVAAALRMAAVRTVTSGTPQEYDFDVEQCLASMHAWWRQGKLTVGPRCRAGRRPGMSRWAAVVVLCLGEPCLQAGKCTADGGSALPRPTGRTIAENADCASDRILGCLVLRRRYRDGRSAACGPCG